MFVNVKSDKKDDSLDSIITDIIAICRMDSNDDGVKRLIYNMINDYIEKRYSITNIGPLA